MDDFLVSNDLDNQLATLIMFTCDFFQQIIGNLCML